MAVSKRLRYEVLRRDNFTCRYCGKRAADAPITVDHVVPEALGGTDSPANLVAACAECNAGKAASAPDAEIVQGVSDDALRWAAAMRRAAEQQAEQREKRTRYQDLFETVWQGWRTEGGEGERIPLPDGWRQSLGHFYDSGLEGAVISEAIETAMAKPGLPPSETFRYFCGVCWKVLRERQEIARGMLALDEDGEAP